ncbi:lysine exporter LysO family protein [Tepidibacter mesophilus]|uniref:lysine exporter LysO family protein n=1 Tax=Tepidibacter mesophilus TaxID=655607 RepID=UPI000C088EC3|nr:lysine exporter LysO family protein [Tepidibacter mesophilus]
MIYYILSALLLGIFSGYYIVPQNILENIDLISTLALNLLILSVGIDLGENKAVFEKIKERGFKILLIPFSVVIGSCIGGIICSFIYRIPINVSLSISCGFGWYSLSAVILSKICSAQVGTIAFLSNVFREMLSVILIPIIAKRMNHITSIAPAGATSMDSTLPIIVKCTDEETVVMAFINGAVLSILVPVLVPLVYNLFG